MEKFSEISTKKAVTSFFSLEHNDFKNVILEKILRATFEVTKVEWWSMFKFHQNQICWKFCYMKIPKKILAWFRKCNLWKNSRSHFQRHEVKRSFWRLPRQNFGFHLVLEYFHWEVLSFLVWTKFKHRWSFDFGRSNGALGFQYVPTKKIRYVTNLLSKFYLNLSIDEVCNGTRCVISNLLSR